MRIKSIESIVCNARMRNWVFVKVVTDQPAEKSRKGVRTFFSEHATPVPSPTHHPTSPRAEGCAAQPRFYFTTATFSN
jgi:hypothetical protein